MFERVLAAIPWARDRMRIRHHPITVRYPRRAHVGDPYLLFPSLPVGHKDLVGNLVFLLEAMRVANSPLQVWVTATEIHLDGLHRDPRVVALGPQTLDDMDRLWAEAAAAYAPTEIESFGYPVAEARALGVPILAIDSARNREIGGKALVGFRSSDIGSLADAVALAETHDPKPDPTPFDPEAYFKWLATSSE
jgi:glycosyltransferase involved in cell wall biosynthesis